jgi:hypothetical protein
VEVQAEVAQQRFVKALAAGRVAWAVEAVPRLRVEVVPSCWASVAEGELTYSA